MPNILVNGKSIGGGDDIEHLHNTGELLPLIESMVGKRVSISVNQNPPADGAPLGGNNDA